MKLKKFVVSIALVLTSSFVLTAFNYTPTATVQAASVKLNKTSLSLYKDQSYTLKLIGNKKNIKWTTSNRKIATVTLSGKVTGKSKGTAKITATVGKKKYNCTVKVAYKLGSLENPYSAFDKFKFTYKWLGETSPKTVSIKFTEYYDGQEAADIAKEEWSNNAIAGENQQWVVMKFNVVYLAGENKLHVYELLGDNQYKYFDQNNNKINAVDTLSFYSSDSGRRTSLAQYLEVGEDGEYWIGFLVSTSVKEFRYSINVSTEKLKWDYQWFKIDPNNK